MKNAAPAAKVVPKSKVLSDVMKNLLYSLKSFICCVQRGIL
ncbi:hypothetical protein CU025_2629 [Enterococcus faecium]|nr:hypothetical protein [Enterococcus faecium]MBL4990531.1 hypothetical protein [Enterococcus lactis]MBK4768057.1 hypothetical protein [Enterococcus faecium]MBK4778598.1 hypothetical protein [Enterococcus faecium]MBK4794517.1 hypothetical protein [Enterococcus faecium]